VGFDVVGDDDKDKDKEETHSRRTSTLSGGGDNLFESFEQATPSRKPVKITLAYSSLKTGNAGGGSGSSRSGRSGGGSSTTSNTKVLSVDCYLAAVGRVSNTQGLGLESLGLNQEPEPDSEPDSEQKLVDEFGGLKVVNGFTMETRVKGVYAAGDVVGRPYLASTGGACYWGASFG